MAIKTLTELLNPPSLNDLLGQIQVLLTQQGYSGTDWETDSDSRIILQVEAQTLTDLYQQVLQIAQGGYLSTAAGDWLDELALSQYQLTRFPAIQTIGLFQLTTIAGVGPYTFNAGDLVVTTLGNDLVTIVTFRSTNTTPVTVNPNSTAFIQMTADVPGSNSNIAPGSALTVATPRPGLTVTNPGIFQPAVATAALIGGPFYVNGKTISILANVNGSLVGPITLTFTADYPDVTSLSNALNVLISASPLANFVTSTVVSGILSIQTLSPTTTQDTVSIQSTGSANILIGYSTVNVTTSIGSQQWITQAGIDTESDDSLRLRAQNEWGILGAGTRSAFITWAATADQTARKIIVYSNLFDGTPKAGAVTIYIAPVSGTYMAGTEANHTSLVYNYINPRMPIMSQLFVGSAQNYNVIVHFTSITISSALNNATTKSAINSTIQNLISSFQIGDTLYTDQILGAVLRIPGVKDAELVSPTPKKIVAGINEVFVLDGPIQIDKYNVVP